MSRVEQSRECCPKFDPAPWDGKVRSWDHKKFVKDRVRTLFYMPINFGAVMKRIIGKVERAGAMSSEQMCLSDHTSKWTMDVYLAVDKDVEGVDNVVVSGQYLSKVYDGDFKETGKWCKDLAGFAEGQGMTVKKWYMWYTTCPKCAKKYGKNYVAILAEVEGKAQG